MAVVGRKIPKYLGVDTTIEQTVEFLRERAKFSYCSLRTNLVYCTSFSNTAPIELSLELSID